MLSIVIKSFFKIHLKFQNPMTLWLYHDYFIVDHSINNINLNTIKKLYSIYYSTILQIFISSEIAK
jgi:hypothetical protein